MLYTCLYFVSDVNNSHLFYTMMHVYIGLTFILLVKVKPGYTASCGSLKFEQDTVTEGGFAMLIYTPHNIQASRQWYKERQHNPILLYGSGTTNNKYKYVEAEQGRTFTLSILGVAQADTGRYIVNCGQAYSEWAALTVTPPPTGDNQPDCGELTLVANNLTEGQTATLQFSIRPGRAIKWEKKIRSTFQQLFKGSDYDIVKNSENTIHNLLIYGSKYTDSGEYRVNCDTAAVSNSVHLNIVPTAPSVPAFSDVVDIHDCKGCILAKLNEPVKVACFVEGGSEPVELNMFKDGDSISTVNKTSTSRNGVKIYYAIYNAIPTTADFSVVFTCTVKNPALSAELAKSAPIYIRVDPKTVVVRVQQVIENEPSEIQCITTKGRPPTKSSIYIDNIEENNAKKKTEIKTGHTYSVTTAAVKKFTRFDNQRKAMCCSVILNHNCSNTTNVNVLFPPKNVRVIEMVKKNQDNGDTEVKLKCSVEESNPKSSVEWKGIKNIPRNMSDKTYTNHTKTHGWTFSTIWVFNLTKDDNGRSMRCEVKNTEFPTLELVQLYRPNITYAPVVTISRQKTGVAYLGDDVFLSCNVDSNPPSTLSWHNQTSLIEEMYGGKNLDLKLVNVSLAHSQTYTCTAHNGIGGSESRSVTLIVKDAAEKPVTEPTADHESSSASVAGPVIAGVVVLVVVIAVTVFLYCRKKRQNTPLERKGTYQIKIEDRKPSIHPAGNEPIYNNVAASRNENEVEEQPEYASVVPKQERRAANAHSEPVGDAENESHEKGDNLVYAELDLKPDSDITVSRPLVVKDEPTEYVSIDFDKTGTVTINEDSGPL